MRLMKRVKKSKIKINDLIPNYSSIKSGEAIVNEDKISNDGRWDGLHGLISNAKDKTSAELLSRYHDLWKNLRSIQNQQTRPKNETYLSLDAAPN